MRRFLSFIISLIIAFMSVADGVVAFASASKDYRLNSFAEKLIEMVREHDENVNISESASVQYFYSSGPNDTNDKYSHLPKNAFVSKRLVVKSQKKIDFQGAIDCVSGYRDLYILQYDSLEAVQRAYDYYLALDYIDYVEPDYIMKMQAKEEINDAIDDAIDDASGAIDDFVGGYKDDVIDKVYEIEDKVTSWASDTIGFEAIKNDLATQIKDDYIQVAVLDSGVDTDHEIFEGRLIESNVNFSNSGKENSCEDDFGHGTHVAGIIVDNTLSNVKIKPYKVLNNQGNGTESLIAIAIDLAVAEGADIINISIASDGEFQMMNESVNNAVANDVNVVVAAGNKKMDLTQHYISPACIESAFTVSAVNEKIELSSYSNYNGTIDIAAPGDNINSSYLNGGYIKLSGTSMATPQVSAALAVVYSIYPDKTAKEAEDLLCEYAITLDENEGINKFGAGLLYLKYILEEKPTTADPVFSVDSCTFTNSFSLSISCPEPNATILYVISDNENVVVNFLNGEIYKSQLKISLDTTIYAVAIVKGKNFSSVVKKEYVRANNSESDLYDISSTGLIQGYFGKETDLIIPKKIRGITVKGVSTAAFKDNENIHSVSLPDTATRIYSEAFMGCTALESVTGNGITQVEKNAFANSSLVNFPFEQLTTIGVSAFENCQNLKDVNLTNVTTIQANAFKNAKGLSVVNNDKLTSVGVSAFSGSDIKQINLPEITSIISSAFENCVNLEVVSIPRAKTIGASAFQNCTALKELDISSAETLSASCFENTGLVRVYCKNVKTLGNFAFANNSRLAIAALPKATSIGTYAFQNCPELQVVHMPALITLTNDSFSECPKLLSLWLPSVETINAGALEESSIEYLQLDNVEKINSFPQTLKGFVAPSSLKKIGGEIPSTDFVVYGYEGTYAEQFAKENNKQFETVPAIVYDLEEQVSTDDTFVLVYALGFNCKYQWYKTDDLSNEGGIPIEGATNYYYEPNRNDNAAAYYCVITSDDGEVTNTIKTKYIANALEYREADYSEYNELCEFYKNIDRSLYIEEDLITVDELFKINVLGLNLAQQDLLNSHIEKIRAAIENARFKYVLFDVNADGKISIIDARLVLKSVVGSLVLDEMQTMAADINGDGKVSIADSRAILKSVLNK